MGQFPEYALTMPLSSTVTPDENAQVKEQAREKSAIMEVFKKAPQSIIDWLGEKDIWIGDTRIVTSDGKVIVRKGATQAQSSEMSKPGALNWWDAMPDYVKYGVPAIALFLLLRGRK